MDMQHITWRAIHAWTHGDCQPRVLLSAVNGAVLCVEHQAFMCAHQQPLLPEGSSSPTVWPWQSGWRHTSRLYCSQLMCLTAAWHTVATLWPELSLRLAG